jgi:ADP-sugar diphosphatase
MDISKVHIQSVDMLGADIASIKFEAGATIEGRASRGTVFMQGSGPTILIVLKHGESRYTVMAKQPHVPACTSSMPELPAGCLDPDGNFTGDVAKEIENEIGIQINESEVINLSEKAYGDKYPGMYPSCGYSGEFNSILLCRQTVTTEQLADLERRLTGSMEDGELIKLQIAPLEHVWRMSPDAKALSALCLHDKLIAAGRIPNF